MKYLKLFEEISVTDTNLHVGDYIIIDATNYWPKLDKEVLEFINNNIGQIIEIVPYNKDSFYIKYENIPKKINNRAFINLKGYENSKCFNIHNTKIICASKNKKDLEYIIKYNL